MVSGNGARTRKPHKMYQLTDEEIEALLRVFARATPGPYRVNIGPKKIQINEFSVNSEDADWHQSSNDAMAMAAGVYWAPILLREIRELRESISSAKEICDTNWSVEEFRKFRDALSQWEGPS